MKRTRIAFAAILVLAFVTTLAPAHGQGFEIVPIWAHVHTTIEGDDGGHAPDEIKARMQADGFRGLIMTPHSNDRLPFPVVREWADRLNAPDFIVIAGRELAASVIREEGPMCHFIAVGDTDDILVRDREYDAYELAEKLAALDREGAYYWWAHTWSCPQWSDWASKFHGIEIFNNMGPYYTDGSGYELARSRYFDSMKEGKLLFVTSGIDMHALAQTLLGDWRTYAFPDEFTRPSLMAALPAGHTIAAFNAKVLGLNERPGFEPRPIGADGFTVELSVALKPIPARTAELIIHRDGIEYSPPRTPVLERGQRLTGGYTEYRLSFGDAPAPGETACYVFEITHFMMSSPYCFTVEG